jgi:hypothetical protein
MNEQTVLTPTKFTWNLMDIDQQAQVIDEFRNRYSKHGIKTTMHRWGDILFAVNPQIDFADGKIRICKEYIGSMELLLRTYNLPNYL